MYFDYRSEPHKQLISKLVSDWTHTIERNKLKKTGRLFIASILDLVNNKIVATKMNTVLEATNPLMHAEMTLLHHVFSIEKRLRLPSHYVLVSSHEPCVMCTGAIYWSGIEHIYYLYDFSETMTKFKVSGDITLIKALTGGSKRFKTSEILSIEQFPNSIRTKFNDLFTDTLIKEFNEIDEDLV